MVSTDFSRAVLKPLRPSVNGERPVVSSAAVQNAQNHNLSFEQLKTLMTGYSVDSTGTVQRANLNPDGTVTMVPVDEVTNPAPTLSLGQAKKTIATETTEPDTVTMTVSN